MPYIGFSNTDQQQFAVFSSPDINGTKLIIDADGDTSITADTDDQIDIEIAGSDEIKITAAIPAYSTLELLAGNKIVMQTTDFIRVYGSGAVDVTLSIMEIT